MTYYPTIAELNYKNKNINVKIPIRVKKIQLIKYVCEECKVAGTATEICKYITLHADRFIKGQKDDIGFLEMEYDKTFRTSVPKKFMKDRKTVYCPKCYEDRKEMKLTEIMHTYLFKLYTTASPEYLDTEQLIMYYFPLRWKAIKYNRRTKLEVFYEVFDDIVKRVEECVKSPSRTKRGTTAKMKFNKITLASIEKEYDQYEKRKFVRAI